MVSPFSNVFVPYREAQGDSRMDFFLFLAAPGGHPGCGFSGWEK